MENMTTTQAWERYSAAIESADASRADAAEAARLDLERELLRAAADECPALMEAVSSGDDEAAAASLDALRQVAIAHSAAVMMPAGTRRDPEPEGWGAMVRKMGSREAVETVLPAPGWHGMVTECPTCNYPHIFLGDGVRSATCPACGVVWRVI